MPNVCSTVKACGLVFGCISSGKSKKGGVSRTVLEGDSRDMLSGAGLISEAYDIALKQVNYQRHEVCERV